MQKWTFANADPGFETQGELSLQLFAGRAAPTRLLHAGKSVLVGNSPASSLSLSASRNEYGCMLSLRRADADELIELA